jgi:outer membrane protein assembly factor BamB
MKRIAAYSNFVSLGLFFLAGCSAHDLGSGAGGGDASAGTAGGGGGAGAAVTFQINPAHTGASTDTHIAPPLAKRWSMELGSSVSYPLIADGRVFVTTVSTVSAGTLLYALDLTSGAILWGPTELGSPLPQTPSLGPSNWSNAAYDNGRVFTVDGNGVMSAFDGATGDMVWTEQLPEQWSFSSPPTAVSGTVYLGGAGDGGWVYAVDEAHGAVLWHASVENGDDSSPVITADGVYVAYAGNQVYDLSPHDGSTIWHYDGPSEGGGGDTPVLAGGLLFARDLTGSNIILDAHTGNMQGTFSAGPPPAFDDVRGYFLAQGALTARPLSALQEVTWTFTGDGTLVSAPIVVNGYVYVAGSSGMLYALDAATGAQAWSDDVGSPVSPPDELAAFSPLTGLGAGDGALLVPAGSTLVAY